MGIVPLRLPAGVHPKTLAIAPGDRIEIDLPPERLARRASVTVRIVRGDGAVATFAAQAAVETAFEVELLRVGGVLPAILRRELAEQPVA